MTARILGIKEELEASLQDPSKPWTEPLNILEQKTGVNRLYLFIGCFVAIGLWLIFGFAGQLVCNTVGFAYPAYASIHALESRTKDDDTKWLTYWVVFALFSLIEFFADIIIGWFPLYWLAKCAFLIWLMIPSEFNGSIILYNRIIRPYFLRHRGSIDGALNAASKLLQKEK